MGNGLPRGCAPRNDEGFTMQLCRLRVGGNVFGHSEEGVSPTWESASLRRDVGITPYASPAKGRC